MEMEVEQIARLLAEIRTNQEMLSRKEAKTNVNLKEMNAGQDLLKEEMLTKMKARIDSNKEKVLQGTLVS
jgi:hypothetical protein